MKRNPKRAAAWCLPALISAGCVRQPKSSSSSNTPTVDVLSVLSRWNYPGARVTAGGTTAGLHHSTATTTDPYENVWEFFGKKVGIGATYRADALEVSGNCSQGPCVGRAVITSNTPESRSATFSFRDSTAGIVATVRRAESANVTEIQLTIMAH
jgi:hypothetical protein